MSKLGEIRKKIDYIDDEILALLNKRASLGLEVAKEKELLNEKNFHVPQRELEIYERLRKKNTGPFEFKTIKSIFREIISSTLSIEMPLSISFFGLKGSFTYCAAIKHFGSAVKMVSADNIEEVFLSVEKDQVDYGIVPVENSIEGSVNQTMDLFVDSSLLISGEAYLEVQHYLLSSESSMEFVREVYSHPQPLAQCRKWLNRHMNNVTTAEVSSTSYAAKLSSEKKGTAAIGSKMSSEIYGLNILASRIEDVTDNNTRFLILGKKMVPKTGSDKTSIVFSVQDRSGELYKILQPFSIHKINLTRIESRPSKSSNWKYIFFLDLDGHIEDEHINSLLLELKEKSIYFKILGSYPKNAL